jgi:hypothetical protein
MKTLKKGLSCLLVLNLLLGGGLIFAPKADALQGLLFPFVTTETGKFTFITITNDGGGASTFGIPVGVTPPNLHFTYAYKPTPINNTAACIHFDGDVLTTDTDMMIFEVNRKVTGPGGSTALFEPGAGVPTPPVTSTPLALTPGVDAQAFLIVEPNLPRTVFLFGTAAIIDAATGLAASYSTNTFTATGTGLSPNAAGPTPGAATGTGPDFTAIDGGVYGPGGQGGTPVGTGGVSFSGFKNVAWYPTSVVTSSWFILPLSTRANMIPGTGGGIRWAGRTSSDHLPGPNSQGAFDLDERFFSGGLSPRVRCFGLLTRASFLSGGSDTSTVNGGHTFLAGNGTVITTNSIDPTDPLANYIGHPFMALKFQTTSALGAIKSAVHQEADHSPCFNPSGLFPPGLPPVTPNVLVPTCQGW